MQTHLSLSHCSFNRPQLAYLWMAGIFLTALILANLMGAMLFSFPLLGSRVLLSAGIVSFPLTFILTDLVNEFYGKKGAHLLTYLGLAMSVLVYGFLWVGERLPVDSVSQITHAQFSHLTQPYTQLFIASLVAYLLGQLLDIQVFQLFRNITKHRFIWFRATGSTVLSQLADSFIFTLIAFWGNYPPAILWQIALGNYLWKFGVVVAITPLLYLGHGLLRRYLHTRPLPGTEADLATRINLGRFQLSDAYLSPPNRAASGMLVE